MNKPAILVTRATFPEVLRQLSAHFEVEDNQVDTAWDKQELFLLLVQVQPEHFLGPQRGIEAIAAR